MRLNNLSPRLHPLINPLLFGMAMLPAGLSSALDQHVIAYTGMPVSVPGEDLRIDRLAPPTSIGFNAAPVINASGEVAFWSTLEDISGSPGFGDAIWSYANGTMTPVAYAGQAIPGATAGTYDAFMGRRVILDNAGNIAFGSQVDLTAGGTVLGIFVKEKNGGVRKTVLEGDTVPQVDPLSPAFGYEFGSLGFNTNFLAPYNGEQYVFNGNNVGFSSLISNPSGPGQFNPALYVERPGFSPTGLDLIARSGSDTDFIPSPRVVGISENTEAIFRTFIKAIDDNPSFNAIATYNQANISFIAQTGSEAGGDTSFTTVSSYPGFNNAGQAAFSAKFSDLLASDSGLFKSQDPNGIIATEGIIAAGAPDLNNDGTIDFVFNDFGSTDVLLNGNGKTLFVQTARTPDGSQQVTGMWSDRTGTLTSLDPIAFIGDQAPGLPAGTEFINLAFNSVEQYAVLNGNNEVAFVSQARDGTGPITTGLWAEVDGVLTLIAATGQSLDLPDGSTVTITNINFMGGSGNQDGRPSGFSDNGQITFRADYSGGSAYLLVSTVPILPADLDGDSDVDDADFGLAFAAFTGPNNGPSNNPSADLDSDGDVDDADFALAFAAFTGPGGAANVPEPASLGAMMGVVGIWAGRRGRFPRG